MMGFGRYLLWVTVFFGGIALATVCLAVPYILASTISAGYALLYIGTVPVALLSLAVVEWFMGEC